jgi:hypothetical protein
VLCFVLHAYLLIPQVNFWQICRKESNPIILRCAKRSLR